MDTIPPEILAYIIDSLAQAHDWSRSPLRRCYHKAKFAQYASVSRAWKESIEKLTFQYFEIKSDEIDTFAALFTGNNISRRANLTSLIVDFALSSPPPGCCPVEQILDRDVDSIVFSSSVAKLFTILAEIATRATEQPLMFLCFSHAHRPTGFRHSKYIDWSYPKSCGHSRKQILEAKAVSGYFKLVCDAIPVLHGVTSFQFKNHRDLEDLEPTWIGEIVERLPSLEKLFLRTEDLYELGRLNRIEQRQHLTKSMCDLAGDRLLELQLEIFHRRMENEDSPVHVLVEDGNWAQESWFLILNHVASFQNLTKLQLRGGLVVCPEFFREFAAETADGGWYHERDDEALNQSREDPDYEDWWEDHDDSRREVRRGSTGSLNSQDYVRVFEDGPSRTKVVLQEQFRSLPVRDTFSRFLVNASEAVVRMCNLRKFILKLGRFGEHKNLTYSPIITRVFELWYLKAGMPRSPKDICDERDPEVPRDLAYVSRNRLYWRVNGWNPWEEVQNAWGNVAGPDAKIVFLEESKWEYDPCKSYIHSYEGSF